MKVSLKEILSKICKFVAYQFRLRICYSLDVFNSGDYRPTVFWMGVLLIGWGFIVIVAPQVEESIFHMFFVRTIFTDIHGYFGLIMGVILFFRVGPNGTTVLIMSITTIGWCWVFIDSIWLFGVNAASWIYITLIFRSIWVIIRVSADGHAIYNSENISV